VKVISPSHVDSRVEVLARPNVVEEEAFWEPGLTPQPHNSMSVSCERRKKR
jgi:hypothetical protein